MIRSTLLLACLFFTQATHAATPYAQREDVQAFIADMQSRHAMDSTGLAALFEKVRPIPAVLKAIKPPADPGIRSWTAYRQRFIEPRRIAAGLDFWRQHAATLAKAEALSGVPAEIIVSIIGIETIYGKHLGRFDSFAALTTLAFDYPPRADLFRRELEALLLLARTEGRAPDSYRGSFAGAIGLPQFLPSSIRAYAVDFDGNGHIDLVASAADAIGSVANFLREHGWEENGPVVAPVKVGTGGTAPAVAAASPGTAPSAPAAAPRATHEVLIAEGIKPVRRPAEMSDFGIAIPADAPDAPAALIDLVTPHNATEYWLGYRNFYVITRYNRSSFYAMAVYQFAQTLKQHRAEAMAAHP